MSGKEGILQRHTEIRTALRFFLHSWYKHRQIGAVPYPQQVLAEFIKYKGLGTVIQKLQTPALQVIRKEERRSQAMLDSAAHHAQSCAAHVHSISSTQQQRLVSHLQQQHQRLHTWAEQHISGFTARLTTAAAGLPRPNHARARQQTLHRPTHLQQPWWLTSSAGVATVPDPSPSPLPNTQTHPPKPPSTPSLGSGAHGPVAGPPLPQLSAASCLADQTLAAPPPTPNPNTPMTALHAPHLKCTLVQRLSPDQGHPTGACVVDSMSMGGRDQTQSMTNSSSSSSSSGRHDVTHSAVAGLTSGTGSQTRSARSTEHLPSAQHRQASVTPQHSPPAPATPTPSSTRPSPGAAHTAPPPDLPSSRDRNTLAAGSDAAPPARALRSLQGSAVTAHSGGSDGAGRAVGSQNASSGEETALSPWGKYGQVGSQQQQQPQHDDRKADLGRATWLLLHTLAAQYPEQPSRQQRRDVRAMVDCLTRVYPCGECAAHFAALVRHDPPDVSSGRQLRRWLCTAHNAVNLRLGKPLFNCAFVDARWSPLACDADGQQVASGCELLGGGAAAPQSNPPRSGRY
ncbi:MAG: hypothetical protein WDW36_006381 [Sanguina aurantia]